MEGIKKAYRQEGHGIGGRYCPCCNKFKCHPRNHRKMSHRMARRRSRLDLQKELGEVMGDKTG